MEQIFYSVQDFASALVAYLCFKIQGSYWGPYRIAGSSFYLDPRTRIEIRFEKVNGHRSKDLMPKSPEVLPYPLSFHELSREEVLEALSIQIETCRLRRRPTGKLVKEISLDLPEKVLVALEYVQSGSRNGNSTSLFDGNLMK